MKKIISATFLLVSICSNLLADEIYLLDNTILMGKIINITPQEIEYDPNGKIPFATIERSKVIQIVYEDNKKIMLNKPIEIKFDNKTNGNYKKDEIYLTDNKVLKGKIINIYPQFILYKPDGINPFVATILTSQVEKIVCGNNNQVVLNKSIINSIDNSIHYNRDENNKNNTFVHPLIRLGVLLSYGISGGAIYEKDDDLCHNYPEYNNSSNFGIHFHGGFEIDLIFPSTSRTRFGIKGRYLKIEGDNTKYDSESDMLYSYKNWQVGPALHIHDLYDKNGTFQLFILYGRIYKGELNAIPGVRSENLVQMHKSEYHTTFKGYTICAGLGLHYHFTKCFPFTLGMNLTYTYAKFQFDNELPLYESDHTSFGAVGIEIVGGVYF